MNRHHLFRALAAVALLLSAPTAARAACDRLCLEQMLDSYFNALAAHDPSRLALSPDVRFTENGAVRKIGEGMWQRAGAATYRLDATDPLTESAASNAVVPDNGQLAILFVRLKVVDEKITELETIVVRQGEGQHSTPESLQDPTPYNLFVPTSLMASREEMTLAIEAYLDSLAVAGTAAFKPAPIADDAKRVENGVQPPPSTDDNPRPSINLMLRGRATDDKLRVSDRRYPVFDEARGIAVVIAIRNLDTPTAPAGHAVPHTGMWKQIVVEFYKVADGMIREIQATMYDLDDRAIQSHGWPVASGARP